MGYTGTNISGCNSPTVGNDKSTYSAAFDAAMAALDAHDHSSNKGLPVGTSALSDLAVTTGKLADAAVTSAKLAAAVAGAGLAGGAGSALSVNVDGTTIEISTDTLNVKAGGIGTTQLADAGVTAAKLAAAVAGDGLAGGAGTALSVNVDGTTITISADTLGVPAGGIGTTQLATNAVTTVKITDANVTTAKIADLNVTTAKIADSNVTTAKINDLAVTAAKIANATITTTQISATAGIVGTQLANATVTATQLAAAIAGAGLAGGAGTALSVNVDGTTLEITTDTLNVKAGGIGTTQLAADAVTTAKILDGNVTLAKLATVTSHATAATLGKMLLTASCGAFQTTSSSYTDVTNLTGSIVVSGNRPVRVAIIADDSGTASYWGVNRFASPETTIALQVVRGATAIGAYQPQPNLTLSGTLEWIDYVSAGTYTYKVRVKSTGGDNVLIGYSRLMVYEL